MTEIIFPELSAKEPDTEGVVSTWFVADGETVTEGQLVAEVAVDKVDAEIHAPTAGTIHRTVAEGDTVRQGTPIATLT